MKILMIGQGILNMVHHLLVEPQTDCQTNYNVTSVSSYEKESNQSINQSNFISILHIQYTRNINIYKKEANATKVKKKTRKNMEEQLENQ